MSRNIITLTSTITARYRIGKTMPNRILYLIIDARSSSRDKA